ncbi:hypothetical protein OK016_02245 [Vibrio chagasii]|nr:hypothetical protein [Vibrio chagasii]
MKVLSTSHLACLMVPDMAHNRTARTLLTWRDSAYLVVFTTSEAPRRNNSCRKPSDMAIRSGDIQAKWWS